MILKAVHIIDPQQSLQATDLFIKKDKIVAITPTQTTKAMEEIKFTEPVLAFSGLINAHEHLAMNTHPAFKKRLYADYIEWGKDVFPAISDEINAIPFHLRYQWGIVKNIIQGFTTIIQHDSSLNHFKSPLADIIKNTQVIHSLHYDKKWPFKINYPNGRKKMIHLAEGISSRTKKEAKDLLKKSLFSKQIIAIHGISLQAQEASQLGGLVWCPNSNLFLYGQTAKIPQLKSILPILFGTDATISSDWNLWTHIHQAYKTGYLSNKELFQSLTQAPTKVFKMQLKGAIRPNYLADIIISKCKLTDTWNAFYSLEPKDILMILKTGKIVYFDNTLLEELKNKIDLSQFTSFWIQGQKKFLKFNLPTLIQSIHSYYPNFQPFLAVT